VCRRTGYFSRRNLYTDAGTNLKVGAVPKIFFVSFHIFGSKSKISRFGERFRDGQYSSVSFLFAVLLLTVPPRPAICKSGATFPACHMESVPVLA